jgi:cytoskeletal protein RodZ
MSSDKVSSAKAAFTTEQRRRSKRSPLFLGIFMGIFVVIIIVVGVTLVTIGSSLARPVAISNQFIDAIQANDASAAYVLGSHSFKNAVTEASLATTIDRINSTFKGDEVIVNQKVANMNGINTAEIEYSVQNDGSTSYMLITLHENEGQWQVQAFKSGGARFTSEDT